MTCFVKNGFKHKHIEQKFRVCSSAGWCIYNFKFKFLHKIHVRSLSKTHKALIYEPNVHPYLHSPSVIDFIPGVILFLLLFHFIQPFSLPLFSTYLIDESHREVNYISLWEEMRERLASVIKRYLLSVVFLCNNVFVLKNTQWISRYQWPELRYVGSKDQRGNLDSCSAKLLMFSYNIPFLKFNFMCTDRILLWWRLK
jgi:hypothetical protein